MKVLKRVMVGIVCLTMNASDGKRHTCKGAWSPDNISGFGEP